MYSRRQRISYRQLEHWWFEIRYGRAGRSSKRRWGEGQQSVLMLSHRAPRQRTGERRSDRGKGGSITAMTKNQYTCEGIVGDEYWGQWGLQETRSEH